MKNQKEYNPKFNKLLTKVKAAKGGVISHKKVVYTTHEVTSAKKVLQQLLDLPSHNEVSRIKAKVIVVQENGDG